MNYQDIYLCSPSLCIELMAHHFQALAIARLSVKLLYQISLTGPIFDRRTHEQSRAETGQMNGRDGLQES